MILYILSLINLIISARVLHYVGDYIVSTDRQSELKAGRWSWKQVIHLLTRHNHKEIVAGEVTTRRDYLKSWAGNLAHVTTYTVTLGGGFWFGSFLLNFGMEGLFEESFHPFHIIGWKAVLGWMLVNAVLHAFIDRRWPVKKLMINTGSQDFYKIGGAAHVDQALHKVSLWLTTIMIPVVSVLIL